METKELLMWLKTEQSVKNFYLMQRQAKAN